MENSILFFESFPYMFDFVEPRKFHTFAFQMKIQTGLPEVDELLKGVSSSLREDLKKKSKMNDIVHLFFRPPYPMEIVT